MSLKGFTKGVVRAPQGIKQKFNMGEVTKDAVYVDAERRFKELEVETRKLHEQSKKYADAIHGMLSHQIGFSKAIAEIYKPISGRLSDPTSAKPEGNPEGIRACEEYETVVRELQDTLTPELEMIDTRVVKPADEMLQVIKLIRKMAQKRDRKQIDYDRHKNSLKKLQDKKEKSLKDERQVYAAENALEQATQDYEYYNSMLKEDLPKLFQLEAEFIKPLFRSFYYMQLNIFYTLHERMQRTDIGYFDLSQEVEEGYEAKRGDIQEQAESLGITRFKTAKPVTSSSKLSMNRKAAEANGTSRTSSLRPSAEEAAPPSYNSTIGRAGSTAAARMALNGDKKPPPPAAKPKPSTLSQKESVTALYDYAAQAEGDLSFSAGDKIEIIQRTQNANEWWSGKAHGMTGNFPGNYVQF